LDLLYQVVFHVAVEQAFFRLFEQSAGFVEVDVAVELEFRFRESALCLLEFASESDSANAVGTHELPPTRFVLNHFFSAPQPIGRRSTCARSIWRASVMTSS
jgi:hypothetical protein